MWVAGGNDANRLAYSSDGINWTVSASGNAVFTASVRALAWNGSLWVAGGGGTNQLAYSSDGINWTDSASGTAVFTNTVQSVAWNGTIWVAGGTGTNQLAYSLNGIDWIFSESGNSVFTSGCLTVAWNGTLWVAGGSGTNQIGYSYDGITWNPSESGNSVFTGEVLGVAWNGTIWVAVGDGTNQVAYSYDGINWNGSSTGNIIIADYATSVAWNGSLWVAGGNPATATSTDGINWIINPTASALANVAMNVLASRIILPNVGTDTFGGTKINTGFGAPSPNTGRIGDFYIDMTTMTFYGPKINYGWDFGNCSGSYNTTSHIITMNLAWNAVPGAQSYKIFSGLQNFTFAPINQYPTGTGGTSLTGVLLSALTGAVLTTSYTGLTYTYTTTNSSSDARVYIYLYAYSDGGATTRLTPFPGYCLNFFNGLSDGVTVAGSAKLTLDYTQYDSNAGPALINNDSLGLNGPPNKHIYTKSITVVA